MSLRFISRLLSKYAILAVLLSGFFPLTSAQARLQIVDATVTYIFGGKATFQARLQTDVPIKTATLSIRPQGDARPQVETLTPDARGNLVYQYDLASNPLRAFSKVDYWFTAADQDGTEITSPVLTFKYEDNRFAWKKMDVKPFSVHWYVGDENFALGVLDTAQQGLLRIQSLLPLQTPDQVDIYIYASTNEMQETLLLAGRDWVAGHADPDLGVTVVALPAGPDQGLLTQERIPHELMHIMLYQANPGAYNKLPVWFNEGVASISELVPNPDYQVLLETADKKDALIPIASLCQVFPVDISGAQLSYAESSSFTRYLYHQFGSSGLQTLIGAYANGLECSRAVDVSFKTPLAQIESDWRLTIRGSSAPGQLTTNVWPWFLILGLVLGVPLVLALVGLRKRQGSDVWPKMS